MTDHRSLSEIDVGHRLLRRDRHLRLRRREGLRPRGRDRPRRRDDRRRSRRAVEGEDRRDVDRSATCGPAQSAEPAESAQRGADTGATRLHGEPGVHADSERRGQRTDPRGEESAQPRRPSPDTLAHPVDRDPGDADRPVRPFLRQDGLRARAEQREAAEQRQGQRRRQEQRGVQRSGEPARQPRSPKERQGGEARRHGGRRFATKAVAAGERRPPRFVAFVKPGTGPGRRFIFARIFFCIFSYLYELFY